MNCQDFAMWLTGFFELSGSKSLTETQVQIIRDHLDLVFNKVTPNRPVLIPQFSIPPQTQCKSEPTYWGALPQNISFGEKRCLTPGLQSDGTPNSFFGYSMESGVRPPVDLKNFVGISC